MILSFTVKRVRAVQSFNSVLLVTNRTQIPLNLFLTLRLHLPLIRLQFIKIAFISYGSNDNNKQQLYYSVYSI